MKVFTLVISLLVFLTAANAQASMKGLESGGLSGSEARHLLKQGYVCGNGWKIMPGDTLLLGAGSKPNHSYAFISTDQLGSLPMGRTRKIIISKFKLIGKAKAGYVCFAKAKSSISSQVLLDIESAIRYGEILVPDAYKKAGTDRTDVGGPISTN